MARTTGKQASLTLFNKIHNNLAIVNKNRYLSEAGGGSRTRSHPFQYRHPVLIRTVSRTLFSPGQLQLGMGSQPKLSFRRPLMGSKPKYNNLGLGRDLVWNAYP